MLSRFWKVIAGSEHVAQVMHRGIIILFKSQQKQALFLSIYALLLDKDQNKLALSIKNIREEALNA